MTSILLKDTHGIYRLFTGWVDFAKRKTEHVETSKTIYRGHHVVASVEKTSDALAAYAAKFATAPETDKKAKPLTVWSKADGGRYTLPEYLKIRAERKAKKLAKAAKKLSAAEAQAKAEAITAKVFAELQIAPKPTPSTLFRVHTKKTVAVDSGVVSPSFIVAAKDLDGAKLRFIEEHEEYTADDIDLVVEATP